MQTAIDNRLRLLTGKYREFDNYGHISPLTLGKIIDLGYMDYIQYIKCFLFEKEQFMNNPPQKNC